MHKFQKEISTLGLMERLLSINRARFWVESEPEVDITGEEPQSIPFNAPEKWKWVKFSNVARLLNGRAYARSE